MFCRRSLNVCSSSFCFSSWWVFNHIYRSSSTSQIPQVWINCSVLCIPMEPLHIFTLVLIMLFYKWSQIKRQIRQAVHELPFAVGFWSTNKYIYQTWTKLNSSALFMNMWLEKNLRQRWSKFCSKYPTKIWLRWDMNPCLTQRQWSHWLFKQQYMLNVSCVPGTRLGTGIQKTKLAT